MSIKALDRLLGGIADLGGITKGDADGKIAELTEQVRVLNAQIGILEQLRPILPDAETQGQAPMPRESVDVDVLEAEATDAPNELPRERPPVAVAPPARPRRKQTWKRDAVLAVLREDPTRAWEPLALRNELIERGVMETDEGTPMAQQLRRMAERQEIVEVEGGYRALTEGEAAVPRSNPFESLGAAGNLASES